jgi:DNA mismatch endonuclease, patch repair protein
VVHLLVTKFTRIATWVMADILSRRERSALMSRVRMRDTNPERAVRSVLHSMGFRFRLHRSDLPGTPDIVLAKYSAMILVHGCFWHRHPACRKATTPKTRIRFWVAKFQANKTRDRMVRRRLASCARTQMQRQSQCDGHILRQRRSRKRPLYAVHGILGARMRPENDITTPGGFRRAPCKLRLFLRSRCLE